MPSISSEETDALEDNTTPLDPSQIGQLTELEPKALTAMEKMATGLKISPNRKYKKLYLRDIEPTQEEFDKIRERSHKPHFTNERIKEVISDILAKEPNKEIFGREVFIKYMATVVDNQWQDNKVEDGESIAAKKKIEAEEWNKEWQYMKDNKLYKTQNDAGEWEYWCDGKPYTIKN